MLTKNDIVLLKEIFGTKEEWKFEIQGVRNEMKQIRDELKEEIKESTDIMVKEINVVIDMVGDINEKVENTIQETKTHRIILGEVEKRLQALEHRTA